METLHFLQQYWWAVVSLLGALLVFLMFVQGGQTLLFGIAKDEDEKRFIISTLGHKWEITYTTLVTFGGAAFASFPLFYSTSFGGAYWLWLLILFLFVLQAVSYEFRDKQGNLFGKKSYDTFLFLNGLLGTLLIGVAVGTLYTGGAYYMNKANITNVIAPTVSYWANGWRGIECLANPVNLLLGVVVLLAARTMGLYYTLCNAPATFTGFIGRAKKHFTFSAVAFVLLFVVFLAVLMLMKGYEANPANGVINEVPYKYFNNFITLVWPLVLLLAGVVLVLYGLGYAIIKGKFTMPAFYITGGGITLAVWAILICAAFNNTAYFPSTVSLQDSLTLANSSSSQFTLTAMAIASLMVPFVVAYIAYCWKKLGNTVSK
ncbi:MAG: cytochrome d ubiquinol oxidase subunit II [Bacteroidales bacterium]|nr:cytochrome d ubiquinol oxidase subunit II [Bacteroidales bacterium]